MKKIIERIKEIHQVKKHYKWNKCIYNGLCEHSRLGNIVNYCDTTNKCEYKKNELIDLIIITLMILSGLYFVVRLIISLIFGI